ncbi:hypothetical protein ACR3K2_00740 [Cryptosporidium serpentis]
MEIEDTTHGNVNIDNNLNNIAYELVPFDLPLLIIVKALRRQNGLRHKDYSRYRRYCTRRLHHLRSCLKMTCGRNRFQSRPIEIDDMKDPRHLLILISLIERNWSYSNEMSTSHKDGNNLFSNEIRSRYHIIRRLRKSCKYSDLLLKVSEEKCTARSIVEVQAYRSNLMGNYYIQCSDWVKGAVSLINCKKLYQQLKLDLNASSIDMNKILSLYNIDPMSKNDYLKIYDDHTEELEPLIRLCLYHCSRLGLDIESMENLDGNPKIEIESHLINNMGMKIFFNGSEYPLIFPRAEMHIMELHECYNQTKKILSTEGKDTLLSISTNSTIEAYSDVLMRVSTINSMIHEEITNLTVKNGVSPLNSLNSEEWSALERYIRTFQIFITIERDLVLLYQLLSHFNSPDFLLINIINQGTIPKALNSNKDAEIRHPEEGIRLCDFLKMTISEIKSVGEELFKRKEVTMLVEKLSHIVDNCRCLLLSHIYGLLGKFHEAYLLSDLVKSRSDSTISKLEVEWDHNGYILRVISLCKHLHDVINQMIPVNCNVYRAYIVEYQNKELSQIDSNTEDLKYDILKPSYIPIPVKPIMFDIAADYITPPDLSSRYKKEGIVNRMISKATSGFGIFKRN